MEFLNRKSTIIFTRLIDTLIGGYRKIYNDPYMPLSIERISEPINTPWGMADLYSFCHYYEQNGDLMQDPEMCFLMIDGRKDNKEDIQHVFIAPYMFQQANLAIYEESVLMGANSLTKYDEPMQKAHTQFADQWLCNIEQQGFLNK